MSQEKRKRVSKPRKRNERREDMKIIVSASQLDIYIWAISIALMVAVLTGLLAISSMGG